MTLVDFVERNALWMAASNGNRDVLGALIRHATISGHLQTLTSTLGGENGVTALYRAVQKKRHKCARLLVSAGVDLNGDRSVESSPGCSNQSLTPLLSVEPS